MARARKIIYAMWWGGYGYSLGNLYGDQGHPSEVEIFHTMEDVRHALRDRYNSNGQRVVPFHYADGRTERTLLPAVTEAANFTVWFYDPRETSDPYPDRTVTFGPQMGVKVEHC